MRIGTRNAPVGMRRPHVPAGSRFAALGAPLNHGKNGSKRQAPILIRIGMPRASSRAMRPRFSVLFPVVLALATAACVADDDGDEDVGSTDDAIAASGDLTAVFSTPRGDGQDDLSLENAMLDLVAKAAPGSRIRVAIYNWTRRNVARAFLDAAKRGVDVRVVLDAGENEDDDGKGYGPAVEMLRDGLPKGAVTLCARGKGSCIGDHINHNKFLLFSELTDGSKNVVVQSSANFTKAQLGQHNNAVIIRNDAKLYAGYLSYFQDLRAQRLDLSYNRELEGKRVRTFVFPRSGGDTVVNVLDNVRCKKGVSTIRVAMAFFTDERAEIAQRLVDLHERGCDVRVAMRKAGNGPVDASIIRRMKKGGLDVGLYPFESGNNIHSKYLLVDSPYETAAGVSRRKLVFTGSHNYTGTALRHNDETLARIEDPAIFAAYAANWETIKAQTK